MSAAIVARNTVGLQRRAVSHPSKQPKEGWERVVALALKKLGWEYEYEPTCFEYRNTKGQLRGFCPDFQLRSDLYIEVTAARNFHSHRSKVRATMKFHSDVQVVLLETPDLEQLGIEAEHWYELPRIMGEAYRRFFRNEQPDAESEVA